MGQIKLILEKDGQREEYAFTTGLGGLMKAAGAIRRYMGEGWQLVDCTGDDPKIVSYIKDQIASYTQDPKKYQIPIKGTFKTAKDVTGVSAKEMTGAARKLIKSKLLAPFKREKHACDRCGRVKRVHKVERFGFIYLCDWCVNELEKGGSGET